MTPPDARLRSLFRAGLAAADPFEPTQAALTARLSRRDDDARGWIIAIGKASARMAAAALDAARRTDLEIAGGIVVGPEHAAVDTPLEQVVGDHPIPGAQSARAADRIGAVVHAVIPSDHVLVLISGGASSLAGAPREGADPAAFEALMRRLLNSGAEIHAVNAERRRVLRWGGGRLGAALSPAHVHQILLSDVVGDDPATIGSGPCVPDAGSALLTHVDPPVVLGRMMLHEGIARACLADGVTLHMHEEPVTGDARSRATELATWLATEAHAGIHCFTGEVTVALGESHGRGGRCQEFALAASLVLESLATPGRQVTILAAGTDGRDGPTDAAGAIVDGRTAASMREHGVMPEDSLARHDSHRALDAAAALIRTGHTGTNVADLFIASVTTDAM